MSHLLCAMLLLLAVMPNGIAGAQSDPDSALRRIFAEYQRIAPRRDVAALVQLHNQLESAVSARNKVAGKNEGVDAAKKPKFLPLELGLSIGDPGGWFASYDGKLLRDAHAANPRSPLRSTTLFSTVLIPSTEPNSNGVHYMGGGIEMEIDSARAYVREFPRGPESRVVSQLLGTWYEELFAVISDMMRGRRYPDPHDECYQATLTNAPMPSQRRAAQDSAVKYLSGAFALAPRDRKLAARVNAIRQGKTSDTRTFCSPD